MTFFAPRLGATAGPFFLPMVPVFWDAFEYEDDGLSLVGEKGAAADGGSVSTYAAGTSPSLFLLVCLTLIHPEPSNE